MKFLRRFLLCLLLALTLAGLFVAAVFTPAVQTQIARMVLARQVGLQASLGSVSARFGTVDVTDLRLEAHGAVLTAPSLQARLPILAAVFARQGRVRSLVSKGWILDLGRGPAPADAWAAAAPFSLELGAPGSWAPVGTALAGRVTELFRKILSSWELPCDGSLDGVELEGDVLIPSTPDAEPTRVHVLVKGGGLAPGQAGVFTIEAATGMADPRLPLNAVTVRGRLAVAMETARTLRCTGFQAHLAAEGRTFSEERMLTADVAVTHEPDGATGTLELGRGARHLATFHARWPKAARRFAGTWKLDLREADLAALASGFPLPLTAAAGEGDFETDAAFERVQVTGSLQAAADHPGVLAAPLETLGAVTLDARFALVHSGQSLQVDRLSGSLTGARPVVTVRTLQPFCLDEGTAELKIADTQADWLEGSLSGLPLACLAGTTSGFTLAGNDATGEFLVRAAAGGFAVRSKGPLSLTGVSVQRAGRTLGRGLDLSLSLVADFDAKGWRVQCAPLAVDSAGRHLATVEAKASRPWGAYQPGLIAGTWSCDLEALAAQPVAAGTGRLHGRSASGEFSASVGEATVVEGRLAIVGHEPGHGLTASVHVAVDADGAGTFFMPVRIADGPDVSEISIDGRLTGELENPVYVDLSGENVALGPLGLLAGPLSAAGNLLLPAAGTGEPRPCWGNWVGRVRCAFDRLTVEGRVLTDVGGTFFVDHGGLHLKGGRGGVSPKHLAKLEGEIIFEAGAERPYRLAAAASVDGIEAAPLFGPLLPEQDPPVAGRFDLAATFTGKGADLDDLRARLQEEYRLTSTVGIFRLLKVNAGGANPEKSRPVSDALINSASVMVRLFGVKGDSLDSGNRTVSKNTREVLDFTYQVAEIGYDRIAITATRGADRAFHLVELTMNSADVRLTGSGRIDPVAGRSFPAQPLDVELQLSVRGRPAELLGDVGLLSSRKDDQGFSLLDQTVHFGGTLEHVDGSQWRDLLVKAAMRPDGRGK